MAQVYLILGTPLLSPLEMLALYTSIKMACNIKLEQH
jgi:hypothetical protein